MKTRMMMMKFIITAILFSLLLGGCSAKRFSKVVYYKSDKKVKCYVKGRNYKFDDIVINYASLSENIVQDIFSKLKTVPKKIIVTDFVDLSSLDNPKGLGYVFSNSIKDSLIQKYDIKVIEAEVSKYFKISGSGLKILSRDINKLRSTELNIEKAIVGTYTYTTKEIIMFVKLINLKTGVIEGSYAEKLPMNCELMSLLSRK